MNCRAARARILSAVDTTLAIEQVLELEAHTAQCERCRVLLDEARTLEELLARSPEPPIERLDVERSVGAIVRTIARDNERAASTPRRSRLARGVALVAAAAIVLALLPWSVLHRMRSVAAIPTIVRKAPNAAAASDSASAQRTARGDSTAPTASEAPHASPDDLRADPLDPARWSDAREKLRGVLIDASDLLPADPTASAVELAARVDARALELSSTGWPVSRLCETLLADGDPRVERAAVRYLGLRGDRLSAAAIERTPLPSEDEIGLLAALVDAGESSCERVRSALEDPDLRRALIAKWTSLAPDDAARCVERAILDSASTSTRGASSTTSSELMKALASLGDSGASSLLRLASSRRVSEDECLSALTGARDASDSLARVLERRPRDLDRTLCLHAVARLKCARAAAFVEELASDSQRKADAVAVLSTLGGTDALQSLFRLRIADADVAPALQSALAHDGGAALELVRQWSSAGKKRELKLMNDELASCAATAPSPAECAPALIAVAESELLSASDRRTAILLAGEIGTARDAALVESLLRTLRSHEKELRAACVIAIHTLAGGEELARTLAWASPHSATRIADLLESRDAHGKPVTTLFKIARELEAMLTPPNL